LGTRARKRRRSTTTFGSSSSFAGSRKNCPGRCKRSHGAPRCSCPGPQGRWRSSPPSIVAVAGPVFRRRALSVSLRLRRICAPPGARSLSHPLSPCGPLLRPLLAIISRLGRNGMVDSRGRTGRALELQLAAAASWIYRPLVPESAAKIIVPPSNQRLSGPSMPAAHADPVVARHAPTGQLGSRCPPRGPAPAARCGERGDEEV
jgi:hypothetical protein